MATYEDTPLTNFPDAEDNWARMSDVTATLLSAALQYNTLWEEGKIDEANDLLDANPALKNTIFNADKWNKLRDAIIAVERYYLNDVQDFIEETAQSAIGINDNPEEEDKTLVSYSASKVDELINNTTTNITTKLTTVKTASVSSSGWSSSAPYTQTVSVSGITSNDKPIISIYIGDGQNSSTVKLMNKAYSCIDRVTTGSGNVTLYCYNKKPTTTFSIALKGV